ncbi:SpoVR family protein [Alicyclobacillus sp. SO9]|uniref:SpoVR family protein n=1 Tax=Alicyclobacillus sp. SO9 TaxID=2665646 RepID=UPI0018E84B05|nr:SpoVR family protein [Alicyclobacillus sp. SO9]QQE79744.1 SpoVR family protein [Alicyclobacillus sp. SO9]
MNQAEMQDLQDGIERIMEIANEFGLKYFPMRFEVCPADIIYTFGAYGMPTRYNHWSFGKSFHRMKMDYDFGLSRIYELVVNSDPCYAFLLDTNSVLENKTVAAHVLGHSDFFRNNAAFAMTSRDMVDRMASNAQRIHSYELEYGRDRVEKLLDAGMALQQHVDASRTGKQWRTRAEHDGKAALSGGPEATPSRRQTPYDDLWNLDGGGDGNGGTGAGSASSADKGKADTKSSRRKIPPFPERDVMWFLIHHSPILEEWERDVLSLLREEMLYFWPQLETKIMNEGWASLWHLRIMRELDLPETDAVDFAKMHSGVVMPSRTSINPYHIGLAIWQDIEKRWDKPSKEERERFGREPGQGRNKIFEVREMENDVSFLRNYLTKELVEELDLYLYEKVGNEWRIVEKDWEKIRDQICASRTNGGIPLVAVNDGDYNQNGELYLKHAYEGVELDIKYMEHTMPYLHQLWGRNCHLQSVVENRDVVFTYDGKKMMRKFM